MPNKLAAVFNQRADLERALAALHSAGFTPGEVSLLIKQSQANAEFAQHSTLLGPVVAEPLKYVDAGEGVVHDRVTQMPATAVYDPQSMSVPTPKAAAIVVDTLPGEERVPLPGNGTGKREVVDVTVATSPPEAALKDPNALVQDSALGGLLGLLAGTAILMLPGIGPVLAVGPIAGGLAMLTGSAALGTTLGLIAGILKDEGIPEDRVADYRDAFESGQSIIMVTPRDPAMLIPAQTLLSELGPVHLELLEL